MAAPSADYLAPARFFPAVPDAPAVNYLPVVTAAKQLADDEEGRSDPHPQYQFGYAVADSLSGDSKAREETRDGDVVTGSYTVADPDGRIRRVTYTADPVHGFQARVTYDGAPGPVAIPVATTPVKVIATGSAALANDSDYDDYADNAEDDVSAVTVARTPDDASTSQAKDQSSVKLSSGAVVRPTVTTIFRQPAPLVSRAPPLIFSSPPLIPGLTTTPVASPPLVTPALNAPVASPQLIPALNAPVASPQLILPAERPPGPLDVSQFRLVPGGVAPALFAGDVGNAPLRFAFGPAPALGPVNLSQLRFVSGGSIF
jgi:hypothetical protein